MSFLSKFVDGVKRTVDLFLPVVDKPVQKIIALVYPKPTTPEKIAEQLTREALSEIAEKVGVEFPPEPEWTLYNYTGSLDHESTGITYFGFDTRDISSPANHKKDHLYKLHLFFADELKKSSFNNKFIINHARADEENEADVFEDDDLKTFRFALYPASQILDEIYYLYYRNGKTIGKKMWKTFDNDRFYDLVESLGDWK